MGTTQSCRSLPIKEVPRHTWCLFLLSYLTWESFDYLVWRHRWYRLTVQSTTNCIEISLVVVGFRLPHPYLKNSRRYFFWVVDSTLHVISPAAPRSFDIDDTRPKTTSRIIFQSKYFEPIFLVLLFLAIGTCWSMWLTCWISCVYLLLADEVIVVVWCCSCGVVVVVWGLAHRVSWWWIVQRPFCLFFVFYSGSWWHSTVPLPHKMDETRGNFIFK
jgi:hypothetical protein